MIKTPKSPYTPMLNTFITRACGIPKEVFDKQKEELARLRREFPDQKFEIAPIPPEFKSRGAVQPPKTLSPAEEATVKVNNSLSGCNLGSIRVIKPGQ